MKDIDEQSSRPERKAAAGGLIGMLPFFGCYGARDDQSEEEEDVASNEGDNQEGEG